MDQSELRRIQALQRGGKPHEAERALVQHLREFPEDGTALRFLAEMFAAARRHEEAAGLWRRLSSLTPEDPIVLRQLANALLACDRRADAIAVLRAAVALDPSNPRGHHNLGLALMRERDLVGARQSLAAAVALDPNYALAFFNLGLASELAGEKAAARLNYEQAISLNGLLTQARRNLSALLAQTDPAAGRREYERAIESEATQLMIAQRLDEAIALFTQLIDGGSALPYLRGTRFYCRLQCCDWSQYEAMTAELDREVDLGLPAALPFAFLAHSNSAATQLECARVFAAQLPASTAPLGAAPQPRAGKRIHLAYVSGDIHEHATAYLIAGLLESHDRTKFEITLASYGPSSAAPIRARIEASVERFIDVQRLTDEQIAGRLRSLDVDIAIDLKGYTNAARPGIFARRAAPVQVNYLGYPGTMGAKFMDYLIADRHVVPPSEQVHYRESVLYMPDCYQPNDARRVRPGGKPRRADHGLPDGAIVFCCFNQAFKITPAMFEMWMRILPATGDSVLWLYETNARGVENLRAAAARHGVAPERLVFARYVELEQHLARYPCADLFLDTAPYNAHTTASDALWMGVPVLTVTGTTFAGRVATSLLHAVGLPELAVSTPAQYVEEAIRLAGSAGALQALETRLEEYRLQAPLFDTERYARHFENILTGVWSRHAHGAAPT